MASSPDIRSDRLVLRPFSETHLSERYLGWLNNRKLMSFSEQRHRIHTLETCRKYLSSFSGSSNYFWAIEEVKNGLDHIGNMNAYVDIHNKVADIGILIGEVQAQKKGYGLEAWQAVMSFLFKEIGIRKVSAGSVSANLAMIKLMKSAGMMNDGIRVRQYVIAGKEEDIIHMAAFKPE